MGWLELEGRRVLVVGAGGLGAACAAEFAEAGVRLTVADVDKARLKSLRDDARLAEATTLQADLTTAAACEALVRDTVAGLGGLDVVVHAIGMNDRRPLTEIPDEAWDQIITLNLSSAFWIGRAAGRL